MQPVPIFPRAPSMIAKPSTGRIRLSVRLPYLLLPQQEDPVAVPGQGETCWVAQCSLLDVAGAGGSERSALRNLRSALLVFIEACMEFGTWNGVMRDAGFARLELDGRVYWVGGPSPIEVPRQPVLAFSGHVACHGPRPEPAGGEMVRIPSAPEWLIREDAAGPQAAE